MNKKEHILLSAIDTFVEHGSQGSSMNLIAKNAKLPVGSLYTYFCSKEELLNKIYLFIKANEIDFILKKYDDTKSVKNRFFSFYTQFIHFFIKHPNQLKFIQLYIYSPERNLKTREKGLKLFEVLFSIFEDGIAQKIIKNQGRDDLCFYSCGSINSTILYKMTAIEKNCKQHYANSLDVWLEKSNEVKQRLNVLEDYKNIFRYPNRMYFDGACLYDLSFTFPREGLEISVSLKPPLNNNSVKSNLFFKDCSFSDEEIMMAMENAETVNLRWYPNKGMFIVE